MDTKIFLQGFDSKVSSNTSEGLNVKFKGRRKLLPLNDVAEVISQYDQYLEEREKCNIIRLTCQVNPICSNVLFNRITEIVKNEGYSGVTFINYGIYGTDEFGNDYDDNTLFSKVVYKPNNEDSNAMAFWSGNTLEYLGKTSTVYDSNNTIFSVISSSRTEYVTDSKLEKNGVVHPTNAIRDMQLSNEGNGFVYHCGIDIFNNHLIRSNTFKTVCKMPFDYYKYDDETYGNYKGFNTITDLMRDVSGNKVIEKVCFPITAPIENHARLIALHLYGYDDIDIFSESIKKKLIKKYNGWLGFENKSKIKSYIDFQEDATKTSKELEIERPIMYMNGGDFVDMYPSRDLYSFLPKYNKFRHRIEKNWNYCITYPSSSYTPSDETSPFSDILESSRSSSFPNGLNSMKTVYFNENTRSDNGTTQLVMYSVAKHGLSKGDYVNIYKTYTTYRYWVVDKNGNRVSDRYNTKEEAEDELKRLEINDSISFGCGNNVKVSASATARSEHMETFSEKILDNAEVYEIVDDYIFTVFNSSTQISKQWVKLTKNQLRATNELVVGERTFSIDKATRKFMREVSSDGSPVNDTIYYIVNDEYVNVDITAQNISYKKVVGDIECDYYIRIFSKLPNFKFASGDTSSEYEIYRKQNDNVIMTNIGSGETMVSIYQDHEYEFENHIGKLAFAKNVYTDNIGEIVFTDDIDISNLHDNLGRPLTSIFITFIKNNKGYKEWYGYDYDGNGWIESEISDSNVEYSHAFGKVTCGIKTSYEANYGTDIDCINRITNIGDNNETPDGFIIDGILNNYVSVDAATDDVEGTYTGMEADEPIDDAKDNNRSYVTDSKKKVNICENEVWYEMDKHYYGDLCYYDSYNAIERHIDYVMHRFNSAQRESVRSQSGNYFKNYIIDEIAHDDYDVMSEFEVSAFTNDYVCNNFKEGYYYIPHYEIPIKTFDKLQQVMPDFLSIREMKQMKNMGNNVYQFTTLEQHFLSVGDKAIIYDSVQDKYYNLITISGNNDNYRVVTCNVFDEETNKPTPITYLSGDDKTQVVIENLSTKVTINGVELYDYKMFKMDNLDCPSYARVLKDGTCRVIWRDILNNGFNQSDDSVEEYPYTNGAFYVNKKVDIYVRRQDPYDEYWLYSEHDVDGVSVDVAQEDNYIKDADIEC